MIAATARPVGVAVSTPSRKARNVIRRSSRSAIGPGDFGDGSAEPVNCGDDNGVAGPRIVQHRGEARPGGVG